MSGADPAGAVPTVSVPEVRDYARINAELTQLLDAGHPRVRLIGVDGQRLLASGLRGPWRAAVEIVGNAGPELAADLDAPDLRVMCTGSVRDGAGRGLRHGSLLILGDAGPAAGSTQVGGAIAVAGAVGPRAGLRQEGGLLLIGGAVDRLSGERQAGGRLIVARGPIGRFAGYGRRAGRYVRPGEANSEDLAAIRATAALFPEDWPQSLSASEPPR